MGDRAATKSVRPAKRDVIVIDDDDSTNEQPIAKSAKIEEEEVTSSEVVELKKKVAELEDKFQRVCRIAREYELRAESAENLLDSKRGVKDGKDEKIVELEKKVDDLTREKEALKTERTEMTKAHNEKMQSMMFRLSEEQRTAREDRARLALHEIGPIRPVTASTNIFQLLCPNSKESMSYLAAKKKILSAVTNNEGVGNNQIMTQRLSTVGSSIELVFCHVCYTELKESACLHHFISDTHQRKTIDRNAGVSSAAVEYWMGRLKPQFYRIPKRPQYSAPCAARPAQRQAAGAAVATPPLQAADLYPHLAKDDLSMKLLGLVCQSIIQKQLKKGASEVQKPLNLTVTELIIMAAEADADALTFSSQLIDMATLSKKKQIPFVFIKSKKDLGLACGSTSPVTVCSITRKNGSQLESLIMEVKSAIKNQVKIARRTVV